MRKQPRLLLCVVAVLLAHAGLGWLLSRAAPSGVMQAPPHVTAVLRLIAYAPVAEQSSSPQPVPPRAAGDAGIALQQPSDLLPAVVPLPPATPQALAVTASAALAPEPAPSQSSPQVVTIAPEHDFKSPAEVDRIALARPAPDLEMIAGLSWSGIPMRLRLFIDAGGAVVDVKVLRTSETADVMERVRKMFLAAHFVPARLDGADVDSYKDVELNVGGPV